MMMIAAAKVIYVMEYTIKFGHAPFICSDLWIIDYMGRIIEKSANQLIKRALLEDLVTWCIMIWEKITYLSSVYLELSGLQPTYAFTC